MAADTHAHLPCWHSAPARGALFLLVGIGARWLHMPAEGASVPSIRGHSPFLGLFPAMLINPTPIREHGGALELQGVESEKAGTIEPALPDEQALPH